MPRFEKHVFVCTHSRDAADPTGCCLAKDSKKILDFFKEEIKRRGLQGKVRANASGCLDHCAHGPTVVVYPQGVWYKVPTVDDARRIVEQHLEGHQPVTDLLLYK